MRTNPDYYLTTISENTEKAWSPCDARVPRFLGNLPRNCAIPTKHLQIKCFRFYGLITPGHELSLVVDNTKLLLQMLDENQLDFAVIERTFSKTKYDSYLLRMEPFIGICAPDSPLCGRCVTVEELLKETIIVREDGSGTRRIFEERLNAYGYELSDFFREVSISSFVAIKALGPVG